MVTGILDFTYTPYALGDALLFVANVQSIARLKGTTESDLIVMLPPDQPSNIHQRGFITRSNYHRYISNLYPALLSGAEINSVRIFHHWRPFNHKIWQEWRRGGTTFPSLFAHWRKQSNYWSFEPILECYEKQKDIPRLSMPAGYKNRAKAYLDCLPRNRDIISINIRQKANTPESTEIYRDSNTETWNEFLSMARSKYPNAVFVLLGGFNEWDRSFLDLDNVFIPRTHGLGLGEELAIMEMSKIFMGTNSGFAIAATLSDVSYVITSTVPSHASNAGIIKGDPRLLFSLPDQYFCWEPETSLRLLCWLERLLDESDNP